MGFLFCGTHCIGTCTYIHASLPLSNTCTLTHIQPYIPTFSQHTHTHTHTHTYTHFSHFCASSIFLPYLRSALTILPISIPLGSSFLSTYTLFRFWPWIKAFLVLMSTHPNPSRHKSMSANTNKSPNCREPIPR